MLRIGVPDSIDRELLEYLPQGVQLEILPAQIETPVEVDFWIVPPYPKAAAVMWPMLRGVRVAQSCLAGVDWLLRLVPREVTVCDARGVHDIPTAEWALSAMLAVLKNFPLYADIQREGKWNRRSEAYDSFRRMQGTEKEFFPPVLLEELHGKRVLIVGYGSIGSKLEQLLQPFEVTVDRIARTPREGVDTTERLAELLPQADVVVLIVPQTSETTGLIGAEQLALMKQGALLVNAARGPVVQTAALIEALHAGRIRAALDVTDPEPLPDGHPLWSAPNLLITPHLAGSSAQLMPRALRLAGQQVQRMLDGQPLLNVVEGEY
jgi:phosphoglycerate dehydrogenase-like enzyme